MRNIFFIAASVAALAATPALAQDDAPRGFGGIYIGGSFGGAFIPNRINNRIAFDRNGDGVFNDTVTTAAGANAFSPGFCNGVATSTSPNTGCNNQRGDYEYMGRIGFDTHYRGLVVGAVGEFGKVDFVDSVSGFSTTPASYTLSRSIKYAGGARARVGFTPNNATLFYGTGGLAYARVRNSFSTSNTTNSFISAGERNAYGYSAGGGVEQIVTNHFSIGLEYLYSSLKDNKGRVVVGQGNSPATNPFVLGGGTTTFVRSHDRLNYNSIRVTAALRF